MTLAPIQSAALAALSNIRHGFFTRVGGVSNGIYASLNCGLGSNDEADHVLENRARIAAHLGASHAGIVTLYQEHGATAMTVTGPVDRANLPKADAVVTKTKGLAIGILTADCGPVLFADPVAKVVAAAHAGWRGAAGGILESAVAEMQRQGATRANIHACLGPCITQPAYEVGDDFRNTLVAADPAYDAFFAVPAGGSKPHFDLPGFIALRLHRLGLVSVTSAAVCTHANESKFFSYRRTCQRQEPDYGRQISAIVVT